MSRSLTFTEEIREAIHVSDRLIVVLGPRAIESEYVRAEWQAALAEHKPVVPVLRRVPESVTDASSWLPPELRQLHAPDLRVSDGVEPSVEPLLRILGQSVPPPAPVRGGLPELPPHFRPRPEAFARLAQSLLGELSGPEVHTGQARVTVLIGMGGVGKTALAAALVEAVRSRPTTFLADGIYWLTGSPLRRLAALCAATPTDPLDDRSVEDAISNKLNGKRFLLVVDDASAVDDIAPLVRVLGPGGRMLVTTRNGELAVGHQRVDLDEMSSDEALALVADWLSVPVHAVPSEARRMIELCGRHPFAIAVNAAAVGQGLAWSAIITALERCELDFAEQRFEEYVYRTVEESLRVSVDALPEQERERYRELAAFIWDPSVPASAVARFWAWQSELAEHRARSLLVRLRQRSLLQLHGDADAYEVRLHDLQQAYLQADKNRTNALGGALLESYEPNPPDAWWTVPDDGYLQAHLVRHLAAARSPAALAALLCAEDAQGLNRWYRMRVEAPQDHGRVDGFAGYVADLAAAAERLPGPLLPLVTASLRSLAQAVPGSLLGKAVQSGRLPLDRAIARARLISGPEDRAAAMTALLPHAPNRASWLVEVLDTVGAADTGAREDLMSTLAAEIEPAESLVVLDRIVSWVQNAASPYERTDTVWLVHPVLERVPAEFVAEAWTLVTQIGVTPSRLFGLLPERDRAARIQQALDAAWAETGDLAKVLFAATLGELATFMDPKVAGSRALEALTALGDEDSQLLRLGALVELLPLLPASVRKETFYELVHDAPANPAIWSPLAARTPTDLQGVLRTNLEQQDVGWIAKAAPKFTGEHRQALVERALTEIESDEGAASMLSMDDAELLDAMDEQQLQRARVVIDTRLTGDVQVRALIGLAKATDPSRREPACDAVLEAISALPDAADRERAYRRISPYLNDRQIADALTAAERIGEPSGIEHLVKLSSYVSEEVRPRVLELFTRWATTEPYWRWDAEVRSLPTGLDPQEAESLLALALAQPEQEAKADLLVLLTSKVAADPGARIAEQATAAVEGCQSPRTRFKAWLQLGDAERAEQELSDLTPRLTADQLAQSVAELSPLLPPNRLQPWVDRVLQREFDGDHLLERIAPQLDQRQARTYLARILVWKEPQDRLRLIEAMDTTLPGVADEDEAPAVGALTRRLGELGAAEEAWSLLAVARDDESTAAGLVELAPFLPSERVRTIEARVLNAPPKGFMVPIPDGIGRVGGGQSYLIGRLAPSLARAGLPDRALQYARASDSGYWKIPALLGIADVLHDGARTDVLIEAFTVLSGLAAVFQSGHANNLARAVATTPEAAAQIWPRVLQWSQQRTRREAIEILASFAPVAGSVGGPELADEVFISMDRVLRWWP
jgi:hypothetical protein